MADRHASPDFLQGVLWVTNDFRVRTYLSLLSQLWRWCYISENAAFSRRQRAAGPSLEESAPPRSRRQPITGHPADRLLLACDWRCVYVWVDRRFRMLKKKSDKSHKTFVHSLILHIRNFHPSVIAWTRPHELRFKLPICISPCNTHKIHAAFVHEARTSLLNMVLACSSQWDDALYPNWWQHVLEIKS